MTMQDEIRKIAAATPEGPIPVARSDWEVFVDEISPTPEDAEERKKTWFKPGNFEGRPMIIADPLPQDEPIYITDTATPRNDVVPVPGVKAVPGYRVLVTQQFEDGNTVTRYEQFVDTMDLSKLILAVNQA